MMKLVVVIIAILALLSLVACQSEPNELIFNTPEPTGSVNMTPGFWVVFSHSLTDEEFHTAFPNLIGNPFDEAVAYYDSTGTLIELRARAWSSDDTPNQLEVRIWRDGFGGDLHKHLFAYDFIPQISNIYDVPVTVFMIQTGWDNWMSFRAEFILDDFVYRVKFSDYAESGQAWMMEIVSSLILGGTDFADWKLYSRT